MIGVVVCLWALVLMVGAGALGIIAAIDEQTAVALETNRLMARAIRGERT